MALSFGPSKTEATDYFFHIPRTGGNYTIRIINTLRRGGVPIFKKHRGHAHASPINMAAGTGGIQRSFTIVRPPLDWYKSFYRFRIVKHYVGKNMAPGHPLDKHIWAGRYREDGHIYDFEHFVSAVQAEYPDGYVASLYKRFVGHVDMVLSTDNVSRELADLMVYWGYDRPDMIKGKKNNTTDIEGNWVAPKHFKRWAARGHGVDALPVDLKPGTLNLMERRERKIIDWMRRLK